MNLNARVVQRQETKDLKSLQCRFESDRAHQSIKLGVKLKNEADFKRIYKQSIKQLRGFSMSLAAPMISGIPDLFICVPSFAPFMLEAKWFGKVTPAFSRKIPYSPLQNNWLKEIHSINPYTAFGLVGFEWNGEVYAVLVPAGIETLSFRFEDSFPYAVYSRQSKTFDLTKMFEASKIPRLNHFRYGVCAA